MQGCRMVLLAAMAAWALCGCAAIGEAAGKVNWWRIAAGACLRLSDTLNSKAEEADETKAAQEEQEKQEGEESPPAEK